MLLEDYFEFISSDDIRLKGSRVGIETVLYDFIHRRRSPEEIVDSYPTLSLEQVYATIVYYLHNQEVISRYLESWLEWGRQQRERGALQSNAQIERIRAEHMSRQATTVVA